jgi:hypothetical protein
MSFHVPSSCSTGELLFNQNKQGCGKAHHFAGQAHHSISQEGKYKSHCSYHEGNLNIFNNNRLAEMLPVWVQIKECKNCPFDDMSPYPPFDIIMNSNLNCYLGKIVLPIDWIPPNLTTTFNCFPFTIILLRRGQHQQPCIPVLVSIPLQQQE